MKRRKECTEIREFTNDRYSLLRITIFIKYSMAAYLGGLGIDSGMLLKWYLKLGCEGRGCISLVPDKCQLWSLVDMDMKLFFFT
jgi:hypothetical protein